MADSRIDIVVTSKVRDAISGLGRVASSIGKIGLAGAGIAGTGLVALTAASIKAAASYETLELRLEAVTGSAQKAKRIFGELRTFAASTPLQLGDLTEARILLEGIGVTGQKALEKAASAAAALNKPIIEVASAVASIETEPLRRMGIEVRRVGDEATFSFRDKFGRSIKAVSKGIDETRRRLLDIFNVKFGGFLEKASRTFGGLTSTLGDKLTEASASFGKAFLPYAKRFVDSLSGFIDGLISSGKIEAFGRSIVAGMLTARDVALDIADNIKNGFISIPEILAKSAVLFVRVGSIVGGAIASGIINRLSTSGLPGTGGLFRAREESAFQQLSALERQGKIPTSALFALTASNDNSRASRLDRLLRQESFLNAFDIGSTTSGITERLGLAASQFSSGLGIRDIPSQYQSNLASITGGSFGVFRVMRDNALMASGLQYTGRTVSGPSTIDRAVKGDYVLVRDQGQEENTKILSSILAELRGGVAATAQ